MEQARLVRLALSVAIDRNAINKNILNDLGLPIYSEYMGPEYPGWDATRDSGCWDVGDIGKGTAAAAPPTNELVLELKLSWVTVFLGNSLMVVET